VFDTYAAEWLESRRSRISVASFKAWEGSLKNHILPRLGGKALTAIRPSDIEYALRSDDMWTGYATRRPPRFGTSAGRRSRRCALACSQSSSALCAMGWSSRTRSARSVLNPPLRKLNDHSRCSILSGRNRWFGACLGCRLAMTLGSMLVGRRPGATAQWFHEMADLAASQHAQPRHRSRIPTSPGTPMGS